MKRIHFITTLCLLWSVVAGAQVSFDAKVSKQKLGINERLRVEFAVNHDGDNFRHPSFEGFRVVMGPNQSISQQWVNGKMSFSKTYGFILSPTARGKFTIGQATIEIDGQTYKTQPIDVEVTAAVDAPAEGVTAQHAATEGVHLVAELSKQKPYLNEAVTVTYKLYVSPETAVRGWKEMDSPKFADFWSQNIDNQQFSVQEGSYQGKPYRYVVLRSTVLYPQKTGKLEIEPLTLDVTIDIPTNRRNIFGQRISTQTHKTVSAGRQTLEVKPLPTAGKPLNFSGAVGRFKLDVTANKDKLDATESMDVVVQVSGTGNLKLFNPPTLEVPAHFEKYEPEFRDRVTTTAAGMRGSISHNYAVIPQAKGNFEIAPIHFSYFDPSTETYHTVSSPALPVEVERGPAASGAAVGSAPGKQAVVATDKQFNYIKLRTQLKPLGQGGFFGSGLFWSLLGGPLLLIPLVVLTTQKRRARQADAEGQRLRRVNKLAKKYLSETKQNRHDTARFYESLERALHNYLKAKLSIETTDFSKEKIAELLDEKEVPAEQAGDFIQILKSCEFARYTPASQGVIQEDYDKAISVIAAMDKQL